MKRILIVAVVLCAACSRPATDMATDTVAKDTVQTPPVMTTATPPIVPPAQTTTELASHETTSSVKRIDVAEAKALVDRGAVTVIDVRDADSYAAAHIPGALNITLGLIESQATAIPRGKPVLAYCT